MEYNKTKRGLEKAAGIIGIISSLIGMLLALYVFVKSCMDLAKYKQIYYQIANSATIYRSLTVNYPLYICLIIFSSLYICSSLGLLIFSSCIIDSPIKENGEIINTTKLRITFLIFAILTMNFISVGLIIAVLCLKDFETPRLNSNSDELSVVAMQPNSIESKVAELKHLKELGVIEDEAYNKAIDKIINDYKKELKK